MERKKSLNALLAQKRRLAFHGFFLWHKINKLSLFSKNVKVLLFPEGEEEIAKIVLENLRIFLTYNDSSSAVILSSSKEVLNAAKKNPCVKKIIEFTKKQEGELIQYNLSYPIGDKLVICSLENPTTRLSVANMIGHNGVTKEQIVRIGILGLNH